MKKIAIILPVYNDDKRIAKCLDGIILQKEFKKCTVFVVDDKSTDFTLNAIKLYSKKYKNIKPVALKKNVGAYGARNAALKLALKKFDLFVFIDSDCIAPKGWLTKLLKPLDKNTSAVQGESKSRQTDAWAKIVQESDEKYKQNIKRGQDVIRIDTRNCVIKKEVFEKIGIFNNKYRRSGDAEFGIRMKEKNLKIKWSEAAFLWHDHRVDLKKQMKVLYHHGRMFTVLSKEYNIGLKQDYFRAGIGLASIAWAIVGMILLWLFLMTSSFIIHKLFSLYLIISVLGVLAAFLVVGKFPDRYWFKRTIYHVLSTLNWSLGVILEKLK